MVLGILLPALGQMNPEPDMPFVPYLKVSDHNSFTMCVEKELMDGTKLPKECTKFDMDVPENEVITEVVEGVCIKRVLIKTWHRFFHFCPQGSESLTIPRNDMEAETIILPPPCHTMTVKLSEKGRAEKITHYHDGECHYKFENWSEDVKPKKETKDMKGA